MEYKVIKGAQSRISVVVLLATLLVASCGDTGDPPANGDPEAGGTTDTAGEEQGGDDELFPMLVTFGGLCVCRAPLYLGVAEGIFEKHGLDVEYNRAASTGFEQMGAVATGDAHTADVVVAVAAQAADQGVDSVAVLMVNGDPTGAVDTSQFQAIIAAPSSDIVENDIESLRGKTIGVVENANAHQYLHYTLIDAGLDPDNDINIQHVGPAALPSALESGSVDAIAAWEPGALQALALVDGSFIVQRGGGLAHALFTRWMDPAFVDANPEAVQSFVDAYAEAMWLARQNPSLAIDHTFEAYDGGLERDIIEESLGYLSFDPRVSHLTEVAAEQGLEFARHVGALESDYKFSDHHRPDFMLQTMEVYPEFFEDLPSIPEALRLEEVVD